ncbi:MAG: LTA synthase family protein, partial [Blautia sp.]|nr:LTA synthase family protein [Blautia sp.]
MKVRTRSTVLRWLSPLWQALWCAFVYLVIEAMSRHSLRLAITYMVTKPWVFFFNTCIVFVTFLLVYLFRRRFFVRTLLTLLWLALGVINGVLLANRVTPFTGPDVRNLADGKAVMGKYLTGTELSFIYAGMAFLGIVIIILFIKGPKYRGRMHRFLSLLLLVACAGGMFPMTNLFLDKRILSNYFGNIAFAYED